MSAVLEVRNAELPRDREAIERLWLSYLKWGNDEMQTRHGVHPHSPHEAVAQDMAAIEKFQPPDGCLALAFLQGEACGIGCLRRIGNDVCEVKRMYVEPTLRRVGAGRAILEHLIAAAARSGYTRIRLDSPDFMTAAHALYRSFGFVDIEPYPESEIPESFRRYLIFMERDVRRNQKSA
jgi:GNAT superfamily N-acetyltransferase